MARSVAISIGVQQSGDLVRLPGAATGAQDFAKWAREVGFDTVREFVDVDGATVDARQIRDAIGEELDVGDVATLFVFFAGHGVSLGVDADYWLLSPRIQDDETDGAVNVVDSLRRARRCGLKHLAVFADHCRTVAGKPQQGVYGRPIFKDCDIAQPTEVDLFFAAQPGDVSQEVEDPRRQRSFGIFTELLLEALDGRAAAAAELVPDPVAAKRAVTAKSFRDWIVDAVQLATAEIPDAVPQIPDPRPGSYLPNVLAWLADVDAAMLRIEAGPTEPRPATARLLTTATADGPLQVRVEGPLPLEVADLPVGTYCRIEVDAPITHAQDLASREVFRLDADRVVQVSLVEVVRDDVAERPSLLRAIVLDPEGRELSRAPSTGIHPVVTRDELTGRSATGFQLLEADAAPAAAPSIRAEVAAEEEVSRLAGARGRGGFESGVGLTVVGARPERVAATHGYEELFEEGGYWHVRGAEDESGSAVLSLGDGRFAAVALMAGFVGSVVVEQVGVSHVAYQPARGRKYDEGAALPHEMRRALALASAAARRGRFDVIVDEAMEVAMLLRRFKHYNPAFGILAAYAYDRAGRRDQATSLIQYFVDLEQPLPYDVAMLAGVDPGTLPVPVVPGYPMLTQGWAYLDPDDLPDALVAARRSLAACLWATPTGEGGEQLFLAVEAEEI